MAKKIEFLSPTLQQVCGTITTCLRSHTYQIASAFLLLSYIWGIIYNYKKYINSCYCPMIIKHQCTIIEEPEIEICYLHPEYRKRGMRLLPDVKVVLFYWILDVVFQFFLGVVASGLLHFNRPSAQKCKRWLFFIFHPSPRSKTIQDLSDPWYNENCKFTQRFNNWLWVMMRSFIPIALPLCVRCLIIYLL